VGSLDFNGTISNTNPLWQFEVPPETVILATDMTQYVIDGVVNGENTEFALTALDDAVLFHGNLKARLPQGGAGMVPDIMFSGVEVSVDTVEGASEVSIALPANGGAGETGTITLDVSSGTAYAYTSANVTYEGNSNADDNPTAAGEALDMVRQVQGYMDYYGNPDNSALTGLMYSQSDNVMTLAAWTDQFHARAFVGKSAVVSFPSANIPTTWSASLPITVTVQ
ncbi:hypothetical protein AB4175_22780, partial [Vibrio cyclitrophicus]